VDIKTEESTPIMRIDNGWYLPRIKKIYLSPVILLASLSEAPSLGKVYFSEQMVRSS